jgi:hypothetical protein
MARDGLKTLSKSIGFRRTCRLIPGPKSFGGVDDPKTHEDKTAYADGQWVGTGYDAETGSLKGDEELDAEEKWLLELERQIRVAEWAFKLARYGRTDGVRCVHISIGLQILKNQIEISELAEYHGVTPQRVKQAFKEVKSFELFHH